jgi:hypothetical protein
LIPRPFFERSRITLETTGRALATGAVPPIRRRGYSIAVTLSAVPPMVLTAEPIVIDYVTFSKIHDCHDRQGLTIAQTAT